MAANLDGRPFTGSNASLMRPYMHYCVFVNSIGGNGSSGYSLGSRSPLDGLPGDLFVVALGQYRTLVPARFLRRGEVGTFLHELGHNLGLSHGGTKPRPHTNYKPNYLSVMNYHHQFGFYRLAGTSAQSFDYWDYSRAGSGNSLHEKRLDEAQGIKLAPEAEFADTPEMDRLIGFTFCDEATSRAFLWNTPLDYDCDGSISAGTVAVDTNLDGRKNKLGKAGVDWERLDFTGVAAAAGRGPVRRVAQKRPVDELDRDLILWMMLNRHNLEVDTTSLPAERRESPGDAIDPRDTL